MSPVAAPTASDPPSPAPQRARGRTLAVVAVAAVLAAIAVVVALHHGGTSSGPPALKTPFTDTISAPAFAGRPFTYGQTLVVNRSAEPVTLISARPMHASPGIHILAVMTAGAHRGSVSIAVFQGFPPRAVKLTDTRPIDGTPVPPVRTAAGRRGVELVFGMQVPRPGTYTLDGIRVRYRQGHTTRETVLPARLAVCSWPAGAKVTSSCKAPARWR